MEEMSEISEVSQGLNLNSKTNTHKFGPHYVEASESDNSYNEVGVTPKTEFSNRVTSQDYKSFGIAQKGGPKSIETKVSNRNKRYYIKEDLNKENASKDSKVSYDESSIQGFYVSPVKVTKIDQDQSESHRRHIVIDRLMESSSDISMDDSLVLHNNRE